MKKTFSQTFKWDENIVTYSKSPKIKDIKTLKINIPPTDSKPRKLDTSKIMKEDPFFFQN
tara:strand:- start:1805 stop:1984 length:180 start_codon:yes stop_codon:yes gene_type:complete